MPIVENQVNQFMTSITNKNVEEAYNFNCSEDFKRNNSKNFNHLLIMAQLNSPVLKV